MGKLRQLLLLLFASCCTVTNGQEVEIEDGGNRRRMTFTPPNLSEEDQHGIHLPQDLKCDGCMAVSFTIHKAFRDKHRNIKDQLRKMPEEDVLETLGL